MSARPPLAGSRCIESDLYDRAAIARLRKGSAAWRRLDDEGGRLSPRFPALLDDLFCALFKYNVLFSPGDPVPGSELNRRVLLGVVRGEPYRALRLHTLLDEVRAGLATVMIGESLLRGLREDRVLTSGDLLDLWSLEQKLERAEEAKREAEVAGEIERAEGERHEGRRGGRPSREQRAVREAVRRVRLAARGAIGEGEQKRRQVEAALDRVAGRLDRRVLEASVGAATGVADLPRALAEWGRGLGATGGGHTAGEAIDLGRRLVENPKLRRLAAVFGRVRESALAEKRRVFERADQEIHEVRPARSLDDLARLVPRELVALSHPLLRRDFRRRLLDGGLEAYALRGVDARGRGPMVVCLDVSSSMAGEKELWSKAVALTFVELARRARRRCVALCFSTAEAGLRRFEMNPRTPREIALEATLDLAEHFPGGGTDFETPLTAAMEIVSGREMRSADIVLITDGECAVTPEFREHFARMRRRRSFNLYSILIDVRGGHRDTIRELSDRVALVSDLTADAGPLFAELPRPKRRAA